MKTIILIFVMLSLTFFIGCQENSITDPLVNDVTVNKDQDAAPDKYFHGVIPLETLLADPNPVLNSFYRITGQIEYSFSIYNADPIPPAPQRYLSVQFETNADLQYMCTVCSPPVEDELAGFIADVSEDYIPLNANHVSQFQKTFPIQGREDGMVLKIKFIVTEDRIELNAMWLALPNAITVATDITHY